MSRPFVNMTFRFHGTMDFQRFYRETREFFNRRINAVQLIEKKYKEKADEIEGTLDIRQNLDMWHQLFYEIDYKMVERRRVTVVKDGKEEEWQHGKLRVFIKAGVDVNYETQTAAGKRVIFEKTSDGKESWLHKAYEQLTRRDLEEYAEDIAAITASEYMNFLKEVCEMEART